MVLKIPPGVFLKYHSLYITLRKKNDCYLLCEPKDTSNLRAANHMVLKVFKTPVLPNLGLPLFLDIHTVCPPPLNPFEGSTLIPYASDCHKLF